MICNPRLGVGVREAGTRVEGAASCVAVVGDDSFPYYALADSIARRESSVPWFVILPCVSWEAQGFFSVRVYFCMEGVFWL